MAESRVTSVAAELVAIRPVRAPVSSLTVDTLEATGVPPSSQRATIVMVLGA
jgi:hypothetical protein